MTLSLKFALRDIRQNKFLNIVTVITISLSTVIVSSFLLFFLNMSAIAAGWRQGIRMMAYLESDSGDGNHRDLQKQISSMHGIYKVKFVSKEEAISRMRDRMGRQSYLFESIGENPLPDAFEIQVAPDLYEWEEMEHLANRIASMERVEDVEYGQKWVGSFSSVFNVSRLAGYALAGIFFMASLFIVANTTRLLLYSRREEIEVIRLVGGADGFIKTPLYIESLIQGALGGAIGIGAVFLIYVFASSSSVIQGLGFGLFELTFFSLKSLALILLCAMSVGWMGCYISIKQHLRD